MIPITRRLALFLLISLCAMGDPGSTFKQLKRTAGAGNRWSLERSHVFIVPTDRTGTAFREGLAQRGVRILAVLPEDVYLVSAPDGTSFEGVGAVESLEPPGKISPELAAMEGGAHVVVEFHPDVSWADADAILSIQNTQNLDRPDMLSNQRLVRAEKGDDIRALANWDEVAYVFPASEDLIAGVPVRPCAGAIVESGPLGQYIATVGNGWDGPGLGSASLTYSYSQLTEKIAPETTVAILQRALGEWEKYVRISFSYSGNSLSARNIHFIFARGAHGDPFPFDGPGRILAHTFYPSPTNPEPIAGDMHLDGDESWQAGFDIDLFSVLLHEIGHGLGLAHSDRPTAVMYPYYKRVGGLAPEDIATVRTLYAAQTEGGVLNSALSLTAKATAATSAATADITGTTAGGTGEVRVTWASDTGNSGFATGARPWTIQNVPLAPGWNRITISAQDTLHNTASQVVAINRVGVAAFPVVAISSPGAGSVVSRAVVNVSGTASYQSPLQKVLWKNADGTAGEASGTATWSAAVPLVEGWNRITFTAVGVDGREGTQTIHLLRAGGRDTTAPSVTIQTPSTANVLTSQTSITIAGTSTDNLGVTLVTWATSTGKSGIAAGTANWSTGPIPVYMGTTTIIIRSQDAGGNIGSRAVTVTRR